MRGYLDAARTPESCARRTTRLALIASAAAAALLALWLFAGGAL
ncbi:MAG: hypothetical protein K0R17_3608 [Rariglobus sp.]|nr:hypothetical protein [Rariglobus sp.]